MHSENLLEDGLQLLCQNDPDAESLIVPRRKEIISLLEKYIAEIEMFNPAYGLVGCDSREELVIRHILDSLAPIGIFQRLLKDHAQTLSNNENIKIADVGSGGGLPGIPLAITLPQCEVSLIERMGRRAGFLRNTQAALALLNVAVEEQEMEKAAPGRFALVTFRAFRPLDSKLVKGLTRLCTAGGVLAAYKGRLSKIEEEMAALESFSAAKASASPLFTKWETLPCPTPLLDEERHILLLYTT